MKKIELFFKEKWFSILLSLAVFVFFVINYSTVSDKMNAMGGNMVRTYKIIYIMLWEAL